MTSKEYEGLLNIIYNVGVIFFVTPTRALF
jgi:hypothetical protein